jgi:hypothetical protein
MFVFHHRMIASEASCKSLASKLEEFQQSAAAIKAEQDATIGILKASAFFSTHLLCDCTVFLQFFKSGRLRRSEGEIRAVTARTWREMPVAHIGARICTNGIAAKFAETPGELAQLCTSCFC